MTTNVLFDGKMQDLLAKVQELEDKTAAFKTFVTSAYDHARFHEHFDPIMETAKGAHEIYHELLHLEGQHDH